MGPLTLMKLNHVSSTNYLTCAVDVYSFGMPRPKSYFQLIMWVVIRPLCMNQKQPWFWIPFCRLPCQWTLDSGFRSLEGFWILRTKLWIPNPRISDSTGKNFMYSGIWITLRGAILDHFTFLGNCPRNNNNNNNNGIYIALIHRCSTPSLRQH